MQDFEDLIRTFSPYWNEEESKEETKEPEFDFQEEADRAIRDRLRR